MATSSKDPLRRSLLAVFLLIAVAFLVTTATLALGMLEAHRISSDSQTAMAALLAAERVRRGSGEGNLPDLPGAREVELARVKGSPDALRQALDRYQQKAVETLVQAEAQRGRLVRGQVIAAGVLAVCTLVGLTGLLAWVQALVLRPVEQLDQLAREVLGGHLEPRAPALAQPEFGRLALSMNAMLDSLQSRLDQLDARRRDWELLVRAAPVPLVGLDAAGRVTSANPAAVELAGGPLEGREAAEALPIRSADGLSAWDADSLEGRTWTLATAEGEVPVALERVGLAEGGGRLALIRDVRQQARQERMRQEALDVVGRELRLPLVRIAEAAEGLRNPELASMARHARDLAENLALAQDLRAGRWRSRRQAVNLGDLLGQVVAAHEVSAREREALLAPRLDAVEVLADPPHLRLALHHLLSRSLERCRPGGKVGVACWAGRGRAMVEVIPDEVDQATALREWLLKGPTPEDRAAPDGAALVSQILLAHEVTVEPGPADRVRLLLPQPGPGDALPADEPEPAPERQMAEPVPAAALEQDEFFGHWLRHAVGLQIFACSADLPRQGLEALVLDLDHGPPVVKSDLPALPLLCLAAHPEENLDRFMELGATGLLGRYESAAALRRAVRQVARGETVLCPEAAEALLERTSRSRPVAVPREYQDLTAREQEIFLLIARGLSNKEIADTLLISEGTVKSHVNNLLRKLDLRDRVQLLLYAARHDLLPAPSGEAAER